MPTYCVNMKGRFTAKVIVQAADPEAAVEAANQEFDPAFDKTLQFDEYEHDETDVKELHR